MVNNNKLDEKEKEYYFFRVLAKERCKVSVNINGTEWKTWDELEQELFTPEEIEESNMRVALIGELIKARKESSISQRELEKLSGVKQPGR